MYLFSYVSTSVQQVLSGLQSNYTTYPQKKKGQKKLLIKLKKRTNSKLSTELLPIPPLQTWRNGVYLNYKGT